MSVTIAVEDAQAKLKELVHQLVPGEEVILTENQKPVAKLVGTLAAPSPEPKPARPGPGLCKGMITYMAPDFDALYNKEGIDLFLAFRDIHR